jgi:hypothetical protein
LSTPPYNILYDIFLQILLLKLGLLLLTSYPNGIEP